MSHEDILDDMSLSDDELLENLADDMMMEMAEEEAQPSMAIADDIPTISPVRSAVRTPMVPPMGGNMPDLGQMMSQMMPMMSQMLGGGARPGGAAGNPLFGGQTRGGNTIRQQTLPWDEIVRQHAPAGEADEWIATMRADEQKQREFAANKLLERPPSRAYRTKASVLPNVYMEAETLLASLLNESVRAARLEHNRTWRECRDNLVSLLAMSGLAKVYERTLKAQLRQRVANDPDFLAHKDSGRYSNITQALFT